MAGSNGKIISEGTWGNNSILVEKPVNIEIFNSIYFVDQMSGHRASDISKHEQYKKVEGGGDKDQAGELGDTPDQQPLEVHEVFCPYVFYIDQERVQTPKNSFLSTL